MSAGGTIAASHSNRPPPAGEPSAAARTQPDGARPSRGVETEDQPPRPPAPFLAPAVAFMAGIACAALPGVAAPAWLTAWLAAAIVAALGALLAAAACSRRFSTRALVVCAASLAAPLGALRYASVTALPPHHVAHVAQHERVLTRISGRVLTDPVETPPEALNPCLPLAPEPRTRFVLEAGRLEASLPPRDLTGRVQVTVRGSLPGVRAGDTLTLTGWLARPRGAQNPGDVDWARYLRLQNIHAQLHVEDAVHAKVESAARRSWAADVQRFIQDRSAGFLLEPAAATASDDARGLLETMVLGRRSAVSRAVEDAFVRTGTVHFLSVSGSHVAMLAWFVWFVLRAVARQGRRTVAAALAVVLVLYATVAEWNAPFLRSIVLGLLACAAALSNRPLCVLNWLALSALLLLAANPLELFQPGFQLSFAQVLALFTLVPRAIAWFRQSDDDEALGPPDDESLVSIVLRRLRNAVFVTLSASVVAWLTSIPLTLLHFGQFTPWGWAQSVLITLLVTAVVVLGFFAALVGAVHAPAGALLAGPLFAATQGLVVLVDQLSRVPASRIEAAPPPLWLVAASYVLAGWWLRAVPERRPRDAERRVAARSRIKQRSFVVGAMLAVAWFAWSLTPAANDGALTLRVLAVGNGAAQLLSTSGGQAMLVDVGTLFNRDVGETANRVARRAGLRRLDALAVSHANLDHFSGAASIMRRLPPREFLHTAYLERSVGAAQVHELLRSIPPQTPRRVIGTGDTLRLGDAMIDVLWPPPDLHEATTPNDTSLVLRVAVAGRKVLLTGDIERLAIRRLLAEQAAGRIDLAADVLVAPHHGSVLPRDTEDFLRAVRPREVLVSSAEFRPKLAQAVGRALGESCAVRFTAESGMLVATIEADGAIRLSAPLEPRRR